MVPPEGAPGKRHIRSGKTALPPDVRTGNSGEASLGVLLRISRSIDFFNVWLGRAVAWLIVVAVVVSTTNAIVRKLLNMSSNAWLELQWYLFAAVFLLCASWTLIANEHIRIDIVNNLFSRRTRHWIDLIGHTFALLPFTIVMIWTSVPFFLSSWRINELSLSAGGLYQWPAKALIPLAFTILFVQAISEIIKTVGIMKGLLPDPYETPTVHPAEAEAQKVLQAHEKA
jgi:TRAP-type mannitol/chloroaromatic compound transport system permease small subunit